jgi:hypothetical protein
MSEKLENLIQVNIGMLVEIEEAKKESSRTQEQFY